LAFIEQGKVQGGQIVLSKPLTLPEGTEVVVNIEPVIINTQAASTGVDEEFATLPFFGMWADRS